MPLSLLQLSSYLFLLLLNLSLLVKGSLVKTESSPDIDKESLKGVDVDVDDVEEEPPVIERLEEDKEYNVVILPRALIAFPVFCKDNHIA